MNIVDEQPGLPYSCDVTGHLVFEEGHPLKASAQVDLHSASLEGEMVMVKVIRSISVSNDARRKSAEAGNLNSRHTMTLICEQKIAREVDKLTALKHVNVLPYRGFCFYPTASPESGRNTWLFSVVSPKVQGGTLSEYVRNQDVDHLILASGVADGLNYLHKQGIVHGALKSSNIFVQDNVPKLAEPSLNVLTPLLPSDSLSLTTDGPSDTLRWMAPEQVLSNSDPTVEADIWAFGCILMELLTKVVPYAECKVDAQVMLRMEEKKAPTSLLVDLGVFGSGLDLEFGKICTGCWHFDPQARSPLGVIVKALK
ncbi:kinase-like protein [Sistotremastrum niveocremeum HHB9708]|uniref:Kinase-like protein n=1 Tax=Sistotremastrum niveocremeum HHB9708 TaxID=1314777 RepID=A0A164PDA8_9AGAM|nr:kinase-like protein [Sistotremastrum niveocremeum HHB9708]